MAAPHPAAATFSPLAGRRDSRNRRRQMSASLRRARLSPRERGERLG
ncbi:hypothetical protein SJ05684_c33220 [Sinorhizobium sojae CCBAU 05684]|uniref:Uncharacterized protein n=1 Tax=Sinorhizobium sojae CCBAU 05684 TaxID=716928 RepID=A0A249PGE7_9HYPH|nr:hypothetical protein SJ05684_c33220 [Sinorhizobium sojae CCBAU 05684]